MKTCTQCSNAKPLEAFYTKPNGRPTSRCKECMKARARSLTPEQTSLKNALYRQRCREAGKAINRGDRSGQLSRWKEGKHRWRSQGVEVLLDHPEQCPPWADKKAIVAWYALAKKMRQETGQRWVVDHVIPLRGEEVTGLHIHTNLQIIKQVDNQAKGNRLL